MNGPEAFALMTVVAFGGSTVFILARAVARRIEGKTQQPHALPGDVAMRMERMERTLDSVAIEIERISENQRFLTKVLAERERSSLPPGVIRE
ncbi:MAG TPA: hypothetical protein VHE78_03400 [Gemmatimonadaceae bacterium]|nr:hypothetical protein [Gemmatimonadaceae bacterium]